MSGNSTRSSFSPQITAAGNNVYVVWEGHGTNGYNNIYLEKSTDIGTNFSSEQIVSGNSTRSSFSPQIVQLEIMCMWYGKAMVLMGDNDISFKVSKNGGTSFRNTINLSYRPSFLGPPQIAALEIMCMWYGKAMVLMGTITYPLK